MINQYYWPDVAATAQLLSDLGEDLASAGHYVCALAGRGSYAGTGKKRAPREEHCGVEVVRVWCSSLGRHSRLGRIADYASFFASAAWRVWRRPAPDVVICLSTPPLVALLGLLCKRRGSRFIYKVEDLYPEVAVALGVLREGALSTRILRWISRRALAGADAVVVLDNGMEEAVVKAGAERVWVVPNWSDGSAIRPQSASKSGFRSDHDLDRSFIILYSGNMGLAHRFDAVSQAARSLEGTHPDVRFLFVGRGPQRARLQADTRGLGNVLFFDYRPREMLNDLYAAADVHLVTLRDEVAGLLWPSKYPAALASGRPVLLVGGENSTIWREILQRGVGWCCAHDPADLTDAVLAAKAELATSDERRSRARELFDQRYSRELTSQRWVELVENLAAPQSRRH